MEPVCHTLVGASLGATGLAKKTRFGMATLLVAANLPDIDAVTYGISATTAYAVRRGVTHGVPALVVLPILLAATVVLIGRLTRPSDCQTSFRWLLLLSALGVISHPSLDWLNNYGMRWLMPIVDRWYYGDTLFIFDGIVWTALIAGLVATRYTAGAVLAWYRRPATLALAFVVAYIAASFTLTRVAVRAALDATLDAPPQRVMASPVPLSPLTRNIVYEYANEYRLASVAFSPWPRVDRRQPATIAKGDPALLERARSRLEARQFLGWARFPYAVVETTESGSVLWLADARYVTNIAQPGMRNFGFVRFEMPL
jgi:inner membrane protein